MKDRTGLLSAMVLTTCAAAFGCAIHHEVTYSAINAPPRPFVRRAAADVDVFVGKPPPRSVIDVGLFEVYQWSSTENMIATLRLHAALRGCDAVQVMSVEVVGNQGWHQVVRGVCEMYNDGQAQQAASSGKSAPPAPLSGEGKSCTDETGPGPTIPATCPDPLVCSNHICATPYR